LTPRWETISTNLPEVESTGYNDCSNVLIMLMSIVVPEKMPGYKKV